MSEYKLMLQCIVIDNALTQTRGRLEAAYPERDWKFTGDHCLHQDELFLHFAESTEHRMWWVMVEDSEEIAMSWNMEGMSDLV